MDKQDEYPLVGRADEQDILGRRLRSRQPELIALYGRRRVGKTFLVRRFFRDHLRFEMVGNSKATLREQLANFAAALTEASGLRAAPPRSWQEAFADLIRWLEQKKGGGRLVIFFDEFPWLASPRSRFVPAFEQFWNAWASTRADIVVVIAGSAAAWMIRNVVGDRGGLHGRVTQSLQVPPFKLHETRAFLKSRGVSWKNHQILELHMALGGIPFYLELVRGETSAAQNLDRLCFAANAPLAGEFRRLCASLFDNHQDHLKIIAALAGRREGMTRDELLQATGLSSGGGNSAILEELDASGFLDIAPPFGRTSRDAIYRLIDEFSLFHHTWMQRPARSGSRDHWMQIRNTPRWRTWSGHAFEMACLKHGDSLRQALGISGVRTESSTWRSRGGKGSEPGAQIDLLIDRADGVINLCEMKHVEEEFVIDRKYAEVLRRKREVFQRATGTKKTLFLTMVTTFGVKANEWRNELIQSTVEMDALFEK